MHATKTKKSQTDTYLQKNAFIFQFWLEVGWKDDRVF
jgi:hypothetical protein